MAIPGFRILRKISQGGMSTVYLALQKSVDREVAIKVMSPSLSRDPSFGSRFYREAKIVGQLSHPNIVSIYDVGSYKHYNYIAMDYLPGAPLQDRLEEGIGATDAIRIVREIAAALDYAHERGYIHRDIKPDNILFREDGSAVLCDFGIAKALKGNIKMTDVGSVLGTPHYMSPEQAQGKEIDGRADIYSLGVVFFEMLSGQVPFSGDDAVAVAVKHMTSSIPKLPASHKAFQPIIEKMMAKKAADRFQTGKDVITALDELEATISQTGSAHLTQTGSTTVQVIGLAAALFGTLATAISMSFKRLMLTNIKFKTGTVQLTNKQLEDIDTFILADENDDANYDDLPLIQDTVEQPPVRPSIKRLLLMFMVFVAAVGGAWYFWQSGGLSSSRDALIATTPTEAKAAPSAEPAAVEQVAESAVTDTAAEEDSSVTEPEPVPEYRLTIETKPAGATVKILNIKPRYQDGILLAPGSYNIAVSAKDYFPVRKWVRIVDEDVVETVKLEPTRRLLPVGTVITDALSSGGKGPEMIVIPKGSVTIGGAKKTRTLTLDKALAISRYEISFSDYLAYARANKRREPDDFGWGRDKRPVVDVSYNEARAYARWLSEQTGEHYRLPSREEWEYAARAGTTSGLWWQGDKADASAEQKANCRRGCDSEFSKLFGSLTAPVGSYGANPYGLFDTAGNVEEWLQECINWQDQAKTTCISARVAGGSHADRDSDILATSVKSANATVGSKTIGFRLVLEL